jgi:hypothetical protein
LSHVDFSGGKFVKMSDIVYKLATSDPSDKSMSVPWRIWEIALGRMNNWGHAGFERDELASLITGKPTAGNTWGPENAVGRSERDLIWKYIRVLKQMGRIAPASTSLCLVVSHDIVTRPRGKGGYDDLCCEPGHMRFRRMSWEPSTGWFDPATGVTTDGVPCVQWGAPAA